MMDQQFITEAWAALRELVDRHRRGEKVSKEAEQLDKLIRTAAKLGMADATASFLCARATAVLDSGDREQVRYLESGAIRATAREVQ